MKAKKSPFLFIILIVYGVVSQGCSDLGESLKVSGKAYSSSVVHSKVDWYLLPGGNQQSLLFSSYYVELELLNESGRTIPLPRVAAYFYAKEASLLNIRVISKGQSIRSGETVKVYLDTDGYTEFLQLSKNDMSSPVYLLVCVSGKAFEAPLPQVSELNKQQIIELNFSPAQKVPDLGRAKLANVDDWPKAWQSVLGGPSFASDYLRPPALLRRQEAQTAFYFYYLKPVYFTRTIGSASLRLSDDAIATDIVRSGVSQDTKLVNVAVTPIN
jgi:hypothetical protein